jgi:thiol-disulfide isomerase/thioredoxin
MTTSKKTGSGSRKTKPAVPVLAIVFGAIAVLLVVAIVVSGAGDSGTDTTSASVATPVISGGALPVLADSATDPAVGTPIPEVTGTDYDGNPVAISRSDGPMAILFVAHWCPHCKAEVPAVQEWLDSTGGVPGVRLVSVSTWLAPDRDNYPPWTWLKREGWTVPVLADDDAADVMAAFGGDATPFWVFVDANGNVAARIAGEIDVASLQSVLETLVA